MLPTLLWEKKEGDSVRCLVCSHHCLLKNGAHGVCRTRMNKNGRMTALLSDIVSSIQMDPIEKKPLYHFFPGSAVFSVGSFGCNLQCAFCQNWHISMIRERNTVDGQAVQAQRLLELAKAHGAQSIAFTYNEPTLSLELINETVQRAQAFALPVVLVSNGFMSSEFLEYVGAKVSAYNIDLKSYRDAFYRTYCKASLTPVLDNLVWLVSKGVWVEVTTLVIPHLNDSDEELRDCARFIKESLGASVPWHISAFHPAYKMEQHPPTSKETLRRAYDIGKEEGLHFVYAGNIGFSFGADTLCPSCARPVIERSPYGIRCQTTGTCPSCGNAIAGVFA
ncbi:MAG: AmmeMemoRadiSam system radical SAM enzyme [Desulfovibrio sp.]|nr:AmmeMemoRadiSam system radical SAM enzyme [Desulfovibrio sp.]